MATRTTPFAAGTPCWVDLLSSDTDKAVQFYGDVLGWTAEESGDDFGGYITLYSDGHRVAGLMANQAENGIPDAWNTYISSDNAEATVAAVERAGGKVVAPPMAVGGLGSMAIVSDPAGATVGVWQPGSHTGFEKYNEPGGVAWDECHSKNFDASKRFYSEVFGWELIPNSDTDEFRYFVGQVGGEPVAGLMDSSKFLPPEVPSLWTVYFSVADVDAACERATAGGGRVIRPPEDTPFGRIAELTDPTGALFKLHTDIPQT
jgi:predicted enzyme related to lactoylglutathione lyase